MRLGELSAVTGTTTASIKFYLRSGLLQPGDTIHPTRAEYGDRHVRRLRLIQGLRSAVGLGLDDIRRIVDASEGAGESPAQRLVLLATVQSVVLGFRASEVDGSPAGDPADDPDPVGALVHTMGWPDERSDARDAVTHHLAVMGAAGVPSDPAVLVTYAQAADLIAGAQLAATDTQESIEDFILTAAVGLHLHNRLILAIVALAQASHSIRRYGG